MAIDRADVINRIEAILTANTTPQFRVLVGEPVGLPADGSPFACFWYLGRTDPDEGPMTFGNRMNLYRFRVMCLWHRRPEIGTLESFEKEIWDADVSLRAAFWGDYTLNNEATDLDITDSEVAIGYFPLQSQQGRQALYRSLEFDLLVKELEGEALAP